MRTDKEKDTGEQLEETRQRQIDQNPPEGGMGRQGTPSSHEASQGKFHQDPVRESEEDPVEE